MPSLILENQTFNTWEPGRDTAVLTIGTQEPNSLVTNCIIDANGAEWGLKMPGNLNSTFNNCQFIGGKERALDMVQGSGSKFNNCIFSNGKDRNSVKSKWSLYKTCDIGIKGGIYDIEFNNCILTDILIGDHCIYDNISITPKVKNIVLNNCVHPLGKNTPIILRIYNGEMPILSNGTNAVALVYWNFVVKTYFWIAGKWIDSRIPVK